MPIAIIKLLACKLCVDPIWQSKANYAISAQFAAGIYSYFSNRIT